MEYKNLSILIISTVRFGMNGVSNVILNYFRNMDKLDMKIDFVIPNDIGDDLILELEAFGGHIYKIDGRNKKPFSYINKLTKLISRNNYDIVHAHGNSCLLALEMYAAKKGGAKVRIPHSHNSTCKYKVLHKVLRKTFDKYYTHAFACGQKAGEWLYDKKLFEVIRNGINIDKYNFNNEIRIEYRNKYGFNGKKVIGHVGHYSYQKNHEFLIKVFLELYKLDNKYQLLLIGDGELRLDIEQQVRELGISNAVNFAGKTLEVPQLMQAIDVVVMPSRFEGLPLTLIEAQSACLPCFVSEAVSKEAAITDLVQFISLEKSPEEWACHINAAIHVNRDEIKGANYNQIVASGYSIRENAMRMKELYRSYANK